MKPIFSKIILVLFCLVCGCSVVRGDSLESIQIDTNFPGGNIIVEKIEGDTVTVRPDLRDTEGKWFYWCFRVRGAAGRTLTFNFVDSAPIGLLGPAISFNEGATWSWLGKQADTKSFTYQFPAYPDSVRFSVGMTYTEANLDRFLARIGKDSALKQEVLGQSRKGRDVELLRVGKVKGKPRHRVLITCRAHACEMMTSYVAEGLIEAALANDKNGKWFRRNVEFLVVPFLDKDGVEDGDQGKNRRPRDHNRDYDGESIHPETRALRGFVPRWSDDRLQMTFDLHCPGLRGGHAEFIYIVGASNPSIWPEQKRFSKILESVRKGPLVFESANDLPYGKAWNTDKNYTLGMSGARWGGTLPGVRMATTIEFPYAEASGGEVNADTARAFGHDLARAIREYLETSQ